MFSLSLTIDPDLLDATYQHVHHAKCLELLEKGRIAYLDSVGCSHAQMLERGDALVIVSINAQYKRELKLGKVEVLCLDITVDKRRVYMKQAIRNARGKIVMEAQIGLAFMSLTSRRAVDPPADFMWAIGKKTI
jgi:YbgC/YbaW family acyl-CoA thioester hydrolase